MDGLLDLCLLQHHPQPPGPLLPTAPSTASWTSASYSTIHSLLDLCFLQHHPQPPGPLPPTVPSTASWGSWTPWRPDPAPDRPRQQPPCPLQIPTPTARTIARTHA
uniref:Uncharacterized protein n=1 Tax=Knipowitschia caucasica TaxID=637954 RepID=A0AAV2J5G1_KNICA